MRFYFDIDDAQFEDEFGVNFREAVKDGVVRELASEVYNEASNAERWYSEVKKQIDELVKTNQKEICDMVVERVAEKIAKKKAIVALTPKVSELAAVDMNNITYFEQMIDKAIVKRFGK